MKKKYKKKETEGFFKWISKKWYYWIISIGWGFLSGYDDLVYYTLGGFLGTMLASFIIVTIIFGIIFLIKKTIKKEVKKEIYLQSL